MNPIHQQPYYEASDGISSTTTVNGRNQPISLLGTNFTTRRNSDASGLEPNLGRTKDSFLDDSAGVDNDTQARASGASSSGVRVTGVEENRNRVETSGTTATLSPPHRTSFPGLTFPTPAVGRPPKAPIPSTPSEAPLSTLDYAEIELKQNELRHAVGNRIQSLERTLAVREEALLHLHTQLRTLEEDYQYNYGLIVERDESLEESSQQLQRLYQELKRVTVEATVFEQKLRASEKELSRMKQWVRDVEDDRESTLRRLQKEYFVKEQHVQSVFKEKEAALEEERQRVHAHYMLQMQEIEESRREMEGYTANVTSECTQRHQQAMERLQAELEGVRKKLQSATEAGDEWTNRTRRAEGEAALLRKQLDLQAQRQGAAMDEVLQTNRSLESQIAQLNLQLNKGLTSAENTIRDEVQKNSRLELEKTNLQTKLTEVHEHIQQLLSQREEEVLRYSSERHELQLNYQNAQREMEVIREGWREAEQRLHAALTSKEDELGHFVRDKEEFERFQRVMQQKLTEKERELAENQQELVRLSDQVERWKAAESITATRDRQEVAGLQEKLLNLELGLQVARDEAEVSKRNALNIQERSQEELARLARELHASEAARHALEDQFHRFQDHNSQETLINSLSYEKEILGKRILDLERTNSEIREQVANFTLELQNDPVVKSAREMHRRVDQLQQDLLESNSLNQKLQNVLKEKEEELARYQVDVLRAQILLSNGEDATDNPEALDNGFSGLLMQYQREWANQRTRLDSRDRVRKHNGCSRRHKSHLGASSRSRSSANNSSDTSQSNRSEKENSRSMVKQKSPKRGDRNSDNANNFVVSSSSLFRSPANARNLDCLGSGEVLLKEAEVWRQKYYQLEQHLRKVLLERDRLSQELQLTKQDVVALSGEKQSLLDLNSLLKAQLREAYRTAYEVNLAANGAMFSPTNSQLPVNSSKRQDVMTSLSDQPSAAACTLSNRPQEKKQSGSFLVRSRVQPGKFREENLRNVKMTHSAPETKEHGSGVGLIPDKDIEEQVSSPLVSSAVVEPFDHHQHERLKALEEEIRFVKNQIANTVYQQQQSRQQSTTTRNARRGLGADEGTSVIRKGGQAVRHYGYH
ncbi:unnamed protein product [Phytomonas sp. Hart1]|nr:unnamed protein product [Phytomonas sp. Hart1]|eukprot:CCW69608.1 unnamed protein product [Phytomonas sp. isolate Hart1]